ALHDALPIYAWVCARFFGRSNVRLLRISMQNLQLDKIACNRGVPSFGSHATVIFVGDELSINVERIDSRGQHSFRAGLNLPTLTFKSHMPNGFTANRVHIAVCKGVSLDCPACQIQINIL